MTHGVTESVDNLVGDVMDVKNPEIAFIPVHEILTPAVLVSKDEIIREDTDDDDDERR